MRAIFLASTILAAAASAPAAAQTTTGTVNVTGSVADKCTVTGGAGDSSFTGTFAASELAATDGTLRPISEFSTESTSNVRVRCTTTPFVQIAATPLTEGGPTPPSGYANTISYTALADFDEVGAASETISVSSGVGVGASSAETQLGARLANADDNVVIRANTFATPAPGDLLVAGSYSGQITVTISPN